MITAPACATDVGSLCQRIWDGFGIGWLAQNAAAAGGHLLRILLIIAVALVVGFLARRTISRFTRITAEGTLPPQLRGSHETSDIPLLSTRVLARRRQRARTIGALLRSVVSVVIITVTLILVLGELGININPILASAGIAGVALGFGAQNLVKDFISGIFMMLEDQYGVGDTVDLGPAKGAVVDVGLRTTTVRADDGTLWYVRNGEVTRVANISQGKALGSAEAAAEAAEAADLTAIEPVDQAAAEAADRAAIEPVDQAADRAVAEPTVGTASPAPGSPGDPSSDAPASARRTPGRAPGSARDEP